MRTSSVPTAALRGGDFTGLSQIYDPETTRIVGNTVVRDPIPNNRIPSSRFDPASAKIMAYYPDPNGGGLANNYGLAGPGKRQDDQGDLRIDNAVSDAVKLMGRYSMSRTVDTPSPSFLTEGNPTGYPSEGRQQNFAFSCLHTLRRFFDTSAFVNPPVLDAAGHRRPPSAVRFEVVLLSQPLK